MCSCLSTHVLRSVYTASVFSAKTQIDSFFHPRLREFLPSRCSGAIADGKKDTKKDAKTASVDGPLHALLSMSFEARLLHYFFHWQLWRLCRSMAISHPIRSTVTYWIAPSLQDCQKAYPHGLLFPLIALPSKQHPLLPRPPLPTCQSSMHRFVKRRKATNNCIWPPSLVCL
jgi:hypothetical protein